MEHDLQVVACTIAGEEYAIDIHRVQEIIRVVDITRVPHASPFISGVINLRGLVIPVMDLRKRFALPGKTTDEMSRIIVINWHREMVGILVDGVSEVIWLPQKSVEDPPAGATTIKSEFFTGIGKLGSRLLIILNLDTIIEINDSVPAGKGML